MPNFIDIQQDTPEWHQWRKGKIGASMAPAIMGENPYCSPRDLWLQELGLSCKEQNEAMKRGKDLEGKARDLFSKASDVIYEPKCAFHPKYEWMIASLDGYNEMYNDFIEIKCPKLEFHEMCIKGEIPHHYVAQIAHQFLVTGCKKAFYVSYRPGHEKELAYMEIPVNTFSDGYFDRLIKKELEFLECVKNCIPPTMEEIL